MCCLRNATRYNADESVPAVWELIRKGIEAKYVTSSPLTRNLFWASTWIKDKMLLYGIPGTSIIDALIFDDVREITGGYVFWSICGGSPLSEKTQRFVRAAICPVASAYGLTESCAYKLLNPRVAKS